MPVVRDRVLPGRRIRFRTNSNTSDRNDDFARDLDSWNHQFSETESASIFQFLKLELTRGYLLEQDEERYSAKREKIYSFMKIPRELEKFLAYGFSQCVDAFFFVFTFLPVRIFLALGAVLSRSCLNCFGMQSDKTKCLLKPAEICDLLKACILVTCCVGLLYIDTSVMYHLIKSQSVIKLYIFFNMLEVFDRLFSAFGQDTIDALFWTAIEPRDRRREHLGVIPHLILSIVYVFLHGLLVLFQATTLNVAINSNNKSLLTIMISNQFVELKGSVFKKFDKNNLFQVSCSDVRERFHLIALLFIVIMQTMKEYSWNEEQFWVLLPDCIMVMCSEVLVDWIKHAFISRFNELPADVYRDYTISLAYDVAQTRRRNAFTDHSDWVARRMGFIPLPLSVVMFRVMIQTLTLDSIPSFLLLGAALLAIASFRVLNSLYILGTACDLISQHKQDKNASTPHPWSRASSPVQSTKPMPKAARELFVSRDSATSPTMPTELPTSPRTKKNSKEMDVNLGPAALFSNSTVDINNACLNEELLNDAPEVKDSPSEVTRSTPDIQKKLSVDESSPKSVDGLCKRAESEPSIPLLVDDCDSESEKEE